MRCVVGLLSILVCVASAGAQVIPVQSVPVAAGDQFLLFPSAGLGMGGVSIALDDLLGDPFANPARGALVIEPRALSSPSFYRITEGHGGAVSLPVGLLGRSGPMFGGLAVALQQLRGGEPFGNVVFREPGFDVFPGQDRLSDRNQNNLYAFGSIGGLVADDRVALGLSGFYADLNAVDGVDLLYALAEDIDQYGTMGDVRLGMTAFLPAARTLDVVVLHTRFSMTHDVSYVDWVVLDSTTWTVEPRRRTETNLDRTNTWGAHLEYSQPLAGGWRAGAVLTANRKSHPKIPNYEIMNIPRDPGTTWAYNVGVGLARTAGPSTVGVDVIYEPIRSHTWAEAAAAVATVRGDTIPAGGTTVDNRFRFSNALLRLGAQRTFGLAALQLGLHARSVSYTLRQEDRVARTMRRQQEQWMEWTPTWGVTLTFPEIELQYVGRVKTGTGRPGIAWDGVAQESLDAARAADIIVAPAGPLTLQDVAVWTHQVSVTLPLR